MNRLRRGAVGPVLAALLVLTYVVTAAAESGRRRRQRTGTLEVLSSTLGAEVFVDGERVGEVPLPEPVTLPVGEHSVKVSKRGFTQHLEVVSIRWRKSTAVTADLLALSGVLRVLADVEGARVFVDDDYAGDVPLEQEVEPGSRAIKVSAPGYHDLERTVEVAAGEETELAVELERLPPEEDPTYVPPPPPRRWYEQWWVWTVVGAVVVAVAVTVPLAVIGTQGDYCEDNAGWACDEAFLFDFETR